jgi:predicted Mrr-cat superfamily restriction endonuclease
MDTESANILKILEIPKETKYWLVRAGRGEEYEDFKQSSSIGIQYNQISLENLIQLEKISINVPELTPSGRKRKSETIEKEYNKKKKDLYTSLVLRNIRPKPSKNGASQIGSRLQNFYNKMNIGDIVIVPYRSSRKFLIGIISSEMYELTDDEYLELKNKVELNSIGQKISVCKKRRKITWVNEVNREWINPKLLYTINMHQSIIDITDYGKYIDGLLSPVYIKDNVIYGKISVRTKDNINSEVWETLYKTINKLKNKDDVIDIKSNVESPGSLLLSMGIGGTIFSFICCVLYFSKEISVLGVKFQGIKRSLNEEKKEKLENKNLEIKNEKDKIELKKLQKDQILEDKKRELDLLEIEKKISDLRNQLSEQDSVRIESIDSELELPSIYNEIENQ